MFKVLTNMFWTRKQYISRFRHHARHPLWVIGASLMKIARRKIRRRKNPSKPGHSPTNWTGDLKNNIFFAVVPEEQKVVVGPALFKLSKTTHRPVPALLEFGGRVKVIEEGKRKRSAHVAPRPYMRPTLVEGKRYITKLFGRILRTKLRRR